MRAITALCATYMMPKLFLKSNFKFANLPANVAIRLLSATVILCRLSVGDKTVGYVTSEDQEVAPLKNYHEIR